ncbi:HLGFF motif protein [Kingella negevensis]|uniref:HLGFF motif protein n=1 Tax=Kingella negevensis TaxID=1522312 RepID=UPI00050A2F18|nr:hypothetical protein [Kingella negevensis]MDK4687698.1 hypothetical protein [Kingella negevensis]WII91306.1 hypothetical protein QEO93_01545 [Kingella negevensis]
MHQFSIHTQNDELLGFLIMLADDEYSPQSGQLAIKLSSPVSSAAQPLEGWANESLLKWRITQDKISVYDYEDTLMGFIKQEWLIINGKHFLLNDLSTAL